MTRVLLVDDDPELSEMLSEYLAGEGFAVDTAPDGEQGAARGAGDAYDVVVLDVMLPGLDGFEVLRRIRRVTRVPVLMLTAKGDEVDRIVGLELGADDYLPKPFNPRELAARLRAILRRTSGGNAGGGADSLWAGALEVRPGARTAYWQGEPLVLTSTEYNLLEVLARQAGHVVSKAELSERALGRKLARYDRSIDMHVSKLRRKLGGEGEEHSPIRTVRGVGYQLVVE
ncbi:MAG TPA: response regulator transcription factor [Gammaproteobacteria bacterium]|nr:response regulator transcription factor [Gammaproteobacteria bacterium]